MKLGLILLTACSIDRSPLDAGAPIDGGNIAEISVAALNGSHADTYPAPLTAPVQFNWDGTPAGILITVAGDFGPHAMAVGWMPMPGYLQEGCRTAGLSEHYRACGFALTQGAAGLVEIQAGLNPGPGSPPTILVREMKVIVVKIGS